MGRRKAQPHKLPATLVTPTLPPPEQYFSPRRRESIDSEVAMTASPEKAGKELRGLDTPPIVSAQDWDAARERLLVKEKEMTRARDALAAERRRMPWLAVENKYVFEGRRAR